MGKQISTVQPPDKIADLFSATDYRPFVHQWASARPRGEFSKIALALRIHTTLLSQVLSGRKSFTEEQAARLCGYLRLNALETDYFLKLVQLDRAGDEELRRIYQRNLLTLRAQAQEAQSRVPAAKKLTHADRAIYYSSWQYSCVRLLTSIEEYRTVTAIAAYLQLPEDRVREILRFLEQRGLCVESSTGKFQRTDVNTHVEAGSPLAIRHHQNWRMHVQTLQERMTASDLCFTAPVSISRKDFERVRAKILDLISDAAKTIDASPAKELVYFGVDWIRIK